MGVAVRTQLALEDWNNVAQGGIAQMAAKRPKPAKRAMNDRLCEYVRERLSGKLKGPDGTAVPGPPTTWKGLNKPHRADRRWATAWSPERTRHRAVEVRQRGLGPSTTVLLACCDNQARLGRRG